MDLHETESRRQSGPNGGDDDYIDMEVSLSSSTSSFISFGVSCSPPHSREFEFQMCSSSGEATTSPADELFYKGQLLPLHLPPRLQMVQKLLASSSSTDTPTSTSNAAAASSPRRFSSSEIVISRPDKQCLLEISKELKRYIENPGNSWSKKIKQSSITQKLKASRAFIRALFSKPDPSEIHQNSKTEAIIKPSKKKIPFDNNPQLIIHRRSFSGVIQRQCPAKCSSSSSSSSSSASSSFSFESNGSLDLQSLMRCSNASSEIDNSIEGAIEHCKQSFTARKSNVAESELSSSRTSVSTCADHEIR